MSCACNCIFTCPCSCTGKSDEQNRQASVSKLGSGRPLPTRSGPPFEMKTNPFSLTDPSFRLGSIETGLESGPERRVFSVLGTTVRCASRTAVSAPRPVVRGGLSHQLDHPHCLPSGPPPRRRFSSSEESLPNLAEGCIRWRI